MENHIIITCSVLTTYLICMVWAACLSKIKPFGFSEKTQKNHFTGIDGIRGFLALSVFIHHLVVTYYWKQTGSWELTDSAFFNNLGIVSVTLFFMISGFLFTLKITNNTKPINWVHFGQSRILRIYPLYIFVLCIICGIVWQESQGEINVSITTLLKQIIQWGMFNGYALNDMDNASLTIAGVAWTLHHELIFYISLPLVSFLLNKNHRIGSMIVIAFVAALTIFNIGIIGTAGKYLILFVIGGVISQIYNHPALKNIPINHPITSTICVILLIASIIYERHLSIEHTAMIGIIFLLIAKGNTLFGILSHRSSLILGDVSYSTYLLHGLVLYLIFTQFDLIDLTKFELHETFLGAPILGAFIVTISLITYTFIEKPSMQLGKKLRRKQDVKK